MKALTRITGLFALAASFVNLAWPALPASAAYPPRPRPRPVAPLKEWTFLTYLNGNNNLDPYGGVNINQMELVGSTDQVNIVVQWASEAAHVARRMYVVRDQDRRRIVSPVLQELPRLDMGDWRNLVDFIRWGMEHYPAKRYFVNIWSHGSGWREPEMQQIAVAGDAMVSPFDISPDDLTGNAISTRELGMAFAEVARLTGRKVDLYGSDACLMSMIEVAAELADSVDVFVGSQSLEPGDGWPYEAFLSHWVQRPDLDAANVARLLTRTYLQYYTGGASGSKKEATLSAVDLRRIGPLFQALSQASHEVQSLAAADKNGVLRAARNSARFTFPDYLDLGDFLTNLGTLDPAFSARAAAPVRHALSGALISNDVTPRYGRATGLSIWVPQTRDLLDRFGREYERLRLHRETRWGDAVKQIAQ